MAERCSVIAKWVCSCSSREEVNGDEDEDEDGMASDEEDATEEVGVVRGSAPSLGFRCLNTARVA